MKVAARVLGLAGVLALGAWLLSAGPRDVVLVYDLPSAGAPAVLEVEILRAGETVRRAELAVPPGGGQVRHPVRLPDGDYALRWRLSGAHPRRGERALEIREEGTVLLPLGS